MIRMNQQIPESKNRDPESYVTMVNATLLLNCFLNAYRLCFVVFFLEFCAQ